MIYRQNEKEIDPFCRTDLFDAMCSFFPGTAKKILPSHEP